MGNKVLYVSNTDAFASGGGPQAVHAYLDAVIDIYGKENVTLMVAENCQIPEAYSFLDVFFVPNRNKIAILSGLFVGKLSRFTDSIIEFLKSKKNEYSVCVINGGLTGGNIIRQVNGMGIKTVVIHHNYEVEYHKDNNTIFSFFGHYIGFVKKAEKESYQNATDNFFLTKQDLEKFERVYGGSRGNNKVIGTFDYKNREKETLSHIEKDYDFVISGTLADYQTIVGIRNFVDNYLSVLMEQVPSAKILITGRNPESFVNSLETGHPTMFKIIPNPDKILEIVQRGKIYLCPVCIGGGLKLRAMDGLKCGLPVLVHENAARGYDYYIDKPYFRVYNDVESFKKGVVDLLVYLANNPDSGEIVSLDYYNYFGYMSGVERFKKALQAC